MASRSFWKGKDRHTRIRPEAFSIHMDGAFNAHNPDPHPSALWQTLETPGSVCGVSGLETAP